MNTAYLMVGLPMVAFMWLFLELSNGSLQSMISPPLEYIVISLCSLSVTALIWMGVKIFKNGLMLAKDESELKEKLIIYQKVSERKFVFLLYASIITVVGMYLCASEVFAILYTFIIIIFSMSNPTLEKISNDLRLKDETRKKMLRGEDFNFDV